MCLAAPGALGLVPAPTPGCIPARTATSRVVARSCSGSSEAGSSRCICLCPCQIPSHRELFPLPSLYVPPPARSQFLHLLPLLLSPTWPCPSGSRPLDRFSSILFPFRKGEEKSLVSPGPASLQMGPSTPNSSPQPGWRGEPCLLRGM